MLTREHWAIQLILLISLGLLLSVAMDSSWIYHFIPKLKSGAQIGSISSIKGKAKRRGAGDLIWFPIEEGDQIFKQDLLSTGPDAEVKLKLESAISMAMKPNSFVQVDRVDDVARIELDDGQIDLSSTGADQVSLASDQSEPMTITLGKKMVTVSDENLRDPSYRFAVEGKPMNNSGNAAQSSSEDSSEGQAGEKAPEIEDAQAAEQLAPENLGKDEDQKASFILPFILALYALLVMAAVFENRRS